MMKIVAILVTHSFYPEKLLQSLDDSSTPLDLVVFFHGHDKDLMERIGEAVVARNGVYFPYACDRGLAKSWNEGVTHAMDEAADLILLLNDDLFFYPGCLETFIDSCVEQSKNHHDVAVIYTMGLESGGSPMAGVVQQQGFACCCLLPRTIERLGYFDEAFVPAYFEDADYIRRIILSHMRIFVDPNTNIEHERSKTMRLDPYLAAENRRIFDRMHRYYQLKWGGPIREENFLLPFGQDRYDLVITRADAAQPYPEMLSEIGASLVDPSS